MSVCEGERGERKISREGSLGLREKQRRFGRPVEESPKRVQTSGKGRSGSLSIKGGMTIESTRIDSIQFFLLIQPTFNFILK